MGEEDWLPCLAQVVRAFGAAVGAAVGAAGGVAGEAADSMELILRVGRMGKRCGMSLRGVDRYVVGKALS